MIGAGSAGASAAARLAQAGLAVLVVEPGGEPPGLYQDHPNPSSQAYWYCRVLDILRKTNRMKLPTEKYIKRH